MSNLESKGAYLAANRLLAEGLLNLVGKGPRQQVELQRKHPLARPIQELFWAERKRVDNLIYEVQSAARNLAPEILSAWIQGTFARGEDKAGEPLTVGVLTNSKGLGAAVSRLREAVTPIEQSHEVTIEIAGYTRPDLSTAKPAALRKLSRVVPIFGPHPLGYTSAATQSEHGYTALHEDRDKQAGRLASLIADRILSDPAKVHAAREYIANRLRVASAGETHELREWQTILDTMSTARLQQFLADQSERAQRLRQTLPFLEVLSPEEREEILSVVRQQ